MQTWKLKKIVKKPAQKIWKVRVFTGLCLIATVAMGFYDFPGVWNQAARVVEARTGWLPPLLSQAPFRLGLDLQGGVHLVYEADMTQIPEQDRAKALDGARDVIERRVNAFGVSEPVVQTTTTGGAHRLIIELAGVLDVSEAIALIGETPVLEFMEPGAQPDRDPTEEELAELEALNEQEREAAREVLTRALAGENFDALVAQYSIESNKEETKGIIQNLTADSYFGEFAILINERGLQPGQIYKNLLENEEGANIFQYLQPTQQTEMRLSHILICFEGKIRCENEIPAIEASVQIGKVKEQATPENFAELAQTYSTDPSAASNSGDLGWSTADDFVPSFGLIATALQVGAISDPVETEFGYHLIYKQDERTIPSYSIQRILMPLSDISDVMPGSSEWMNTELSGKHLERAAVEFDPNTGMPYVSLSFNSEGGELFGKLTEAHVGEAIAIFLDRQIISAPVVQQAIYGAQAVITGDFTLEEAKLLAQRLNAGALPVPVELLSQQSVGPTLGVLSLEKSINAALIGFLLVALYMIVCYRLPGFIATIALVLFAFLNLAAYRIFGVTITLAGIAGFVLSLGIAVDGNVLIIERFKEEYAAGRDFVSATDEAFRRAWSAIRDGNLTTLIAAIVLYWFSSSFIKGFALTLAIGVMLSMFTAITVSRLYLKSLLQWKRIQKPVLFGVKRS